MRVVGGGGSVLLSHIDVSLSFPLSLKAIRNTERITQTQQQGGNQMEGGGGIVKGEGGQLYGDRR